MLTNSLSLSLRLVKENYHASITEILLGTKVRLQHSNLRCHPSFQDGIFHSIFSKQFNYEIPRKQSWKLVTLNTKWVLWRSPKSLAQNQLTFPSWLEKQMEEVLFPWTNSFHQTLHIFQAKKTSWTYNTKPPPPNS